MNTTFIYSACLLFAIGGKQLANAGNGTGTTKPNILLIVSEDTGIDLGCYGNRDVYTPNLDRLAQKGVRFTNAYVTYSVCSPSRSTIFTGLYPHQNGQIGLATHGYRMFPGIKTLPVYMKEAGYKTGCVGKIHVNPESDIPWDFRPGGILNGSNFEKKNMPGYARSAARFIRSSSQPFFLMVNLPDAHYPFNRLVEGLPHKTVLPADIHSSLPFIGAESDYLKENTADYYCAVNRLDESVGMLLDSLEMTGKASNTIVIFISDHGPQFSRGKCSNYEAGLKVPFLVCLPHGKKGGVVRNELVSTVDLFPALLEFAGLKIPGYLPGNSLVPLLSDKKVKWTRYLFADGTGSTPQMYYPTVSVRDSRFKLIHNLHFQTENPHYYLYMQREGHFHAGTNQEEINGLSENMRKVYEIYRKPPEFELYDLQDDPYEFSNLSEEPAYSKIRDGLKEVLENWQKQTDDSFIDPVKHKMFNQEIDEIRVKYGVDGYLKDKNFQWKYPDYLKPRQMIFSN